MPSRATLVRRTAKTPSRASLYNTLPATPGVYIMKDAADTIIYVGKAANLKRRVSSYFTRPHDRRIEQLVAAIVTIEHKNTDTALEALILESALIKKHLPFYNIKEKDDKSYLYVEIVKNVFPHVSLVRGRSVIRGTRYGPFLSSTEIREGMRLVRRIFPYATHPPGATGQRPCFDVHLGLCPGTCAGLISKADYAKLIRRLVLFLDGKKQQLVKGLERDMATAAKKLEFERATTYKRQLFALKHIQDSMLITHPEIVSTRTANADHPIRIEGYDISNTSGTSSVGSMVVFEDGKPAKGEYRIFKIKSVQGPDDYASLAEVIRRRLTHAEWRMPDVFLIDGGAGQVHAVRTVLRDAGVRTPVVGIAKGAERKRNDLIGSVPHTVDVATLIRVRDEAHRFAIKHHKRLRGAALFA